jgi:tRNA uracil 4-sulfurtransferase
MAARQLYLIRLGEICLKGENRSFFEKKLRTNIKYKLKGLHPAFRIQKGRFFLEVDDIEGSEARTEAALSTTSGLVAFSKTLKTEKDIEAIKEAVIALTGPYFSRNPQSFKVNTRRSDKSFPLSSYEISCETGGIILDTFPQCRVDVHTPEISIYIEIRDKAYIYSSSNMIKGPGGLPVGIAGKGLLLLSGGIDSPVAGYRMATRGLRQDAIYFHTYPYTSDEALQKVKDLARIIAPYLSGLTLYVVPFTKAQLHINANSENSEHTLLMRYCMVKIANMVADTVHAKTLVTGESLSQVASQTLESITFTDSASAIPVLRPLIGLDKEDIITTARTIGTFETSILPFEDCCTVFSPKHPKVRPDKQAMTDSYESLKIEGLLEDAARGCEVIDLRF